MPTLTQKIADDLRCDENFLVHFNIENVNFRSKNKQYCQYWLEKFR